MAISAGWSYAAVACRVLSGWLVVVAGSAQPIVVLQDNFAATGTHLDYSRWTTVTGPPSYLGRTQLADWTLGGSGQFVVGADGAHLVLNTYNPTGFSLFGTQAQSLASFQPTAHTIVEMSVRLQLTSLQPGIVYGIYFYGCSGNCATQHDEIDIELVTNALQGRSPLQVQLNRYANEPLGAGNGGLVNLPAGFDPLAPHTWTIRWSLTEIDYLVDNVPLGVASNHVPQGPMQADVNVWAPDSNWVGAYSSALQPVSSANQNQSFLALLTGVTVSLIPSGCSYGISPTGAGIPSAGASGTVSVTAPAGCPWSVTGAGGVAITSGSSGTGNGTVGYTVAPNSSPLQQTVALTIAGQPFTIVQQPPVGSNNEAFVRQLYLDILSRTAEATGLNTWLTWINSAQFTRAQVASQFFQSPEFNLSGSYITRLYLGIMLRDPDYGGWTGWFAYLRIGHTQRDILNEFLNSQEFQQRYGTLDQTAFVTLVYNNLLNRAPDPAGLTQWLAWLNDGTYTRADVMNGFLTSPEFELRVRNRVYANMLYIGFLRRAGEASGLDGWTAWLNTGTYTLDQVVGGFISSPEYLGRF